MGQPFDSRIFSYGHRNIQGLHVFDKPVGGNYGFSTEHGSNIEDELNQLRKGNFGWSPKANYNEGVPMTDTKRFPDAVRASWNSGSSTIAVSGLTRLQGAQWGKWNGAYVMGIQKGKHIRIVQLDTNGKVLWQKKILDGTRGRIRGVTVTKDGSLLATTDNGTKDKVLRITARKAIR